MVIMCVLYGCGPAIPQCSEIQVLVNTFTYSFTSLLNNLLPKLLMLLALCMGWEICGKMFTTMALFYPADHGGVGNYERTSIFD